MKLSDMWESWLHIQIMHQDFLGRRTSLILLFSVAPGILVPVSVLIIYYGTGGRRGGFFPRIGILSLYPPLKLWHRKHTPPSFNATKTCRPNEFWPFKKCTPHFRWSLKMYLPLFPLLPPCDVINDWSLNLNVSVYMMLCFNFTSSIYLRLVGPQMGKRLGLLNQEEWLLSR